MAVLRSGCAQFTQPYCLRPMINFKNQICVMVFKDAFYFDWKKDG